MMTKPISPRTKKPFNARNLSSSSMMGYMFIFPAVFALTALVVYPICYGVYISFFKTNLANKCADDYAFSQGQRNAGRKGNRE